MGPKTGIRGYPYLIAGTTGAIAGYLLPYKPLVGYVDGVLSDYIADGALLSVLQRVIPSIFGASAAVLVLGASRRVRAHVVRLLLAWDGWFLDRSKENRKWIMLWGSALRLLMGTKNRGLGGYQDFLPSYPLPSLEETLYHYLESVRPLLSIEEFREIHESVEDFKANDGKRLQRYLKLKSLTSRNWLCDWWVEHVYLRNRGPLAVNSNYYAMDACLQKTNHQVDKAAEYIWQMIRFLLKASKGKIENILNQGVVPFDSYYYNHLFGGCRIPHEECDELKSHPNSRHITVLRKGKYFKVEVLDNRGELIPVRQIKEKIQYIMNLAGDLEDERLIAGLTAQERTIWAEQRKVLMRKAVNKETIEAIESSLLIVYLENEPANDITQRSSVCMVGRGNNIWFDKVINIIIFPDAHMGHNIEHSCMDATVFEHMMEVAFTSEHYNDDGFVVDNGEPDLHVDQVKQLQWDFDGHHDFLEKSKEFYEKSRADSDLVVYKAPYGKRVPKECKLSPDGWIQMAMQLTWYRMHKTFVLTYEAATTRMFYKGRTETIRPVSEFSCQFARCFDDPLVSPEEKKDLLSKAIHLQEMYKFKAMRGQAFDRHLFGLYLLAKYFKLDPFPKFLGGNPFAYRLSTSQTPVRVTKEWSEEITGEVGGFGTVLQEGYGVSYIISGEDSLNCSIHSSKSFAETDSQKFAETLNESLHDMKALFKSP